MVVYLGGSQDHLRLGWKETVQFCSDHLWFPRSYLRQPILADHWYERLKES